jgi:hypothetical protein
MIKPAMNLDRKTTGVTIVANLLFSWTLLPLVIQPGHLYSLRELIEVFLWQVMGAVGWPLALLGSLISLPFQSKATALGSIPFVLIYPISLLLLIHALSSKHPKGWALILLHVLITFSFAAVWHQIINGYDFMTG